MPNQSCFASVISSLSAFMLGTTILFLGQGLFLVLVPLSLDAADFSPQAVSLVVAAYFAGFLLGAWYCDRVIHAVGHIRAYAGLIALLIAAALALPLLRDPHIWGVLRFLHGAAVAGVIMDIESWLNAASPTKWRGRVLGTYTVLTLGALGGGQFLLNLYGSDGPEPFILGAMLLAISIVPVALSRVAAPHIKPAGRRSQRDLYRHSPLGVVTCLGAGLNTGAFWGLAPLFGVAIGLTTSEVTLLMAVTIFGGLCLEWPIGYLSDRFDRRKVILAVGAIGALVSAAVLRADEADPRILFLLLALFGGVTFSLYPLSLAHAADHLPEGEDMVEVSRGLLLSNGIGLALGPLVAGQAFHYIGRDGLFACAAVVTAAIALFAAWRMVRRVAVPLEEQGAYVAVHETTPAILALDPRIEEAQRELALEAAARQPSTNTPELREGGKTAGDRAAQTREGPAANDRTWRS